jgi:hypothetical protein
VLFSSRTLESWLTAGANDEANRQEKTVSYANRCN